MPICEYECYDCARHFTMYLSFYDHTSQPLQCSHCHRMNVGQVVVFSSPELEKKLKRYRQPLAIVDAGYRTGPGGHNPCLPAGDITPVGDPVSRFKGDITVHNTVLVAVALQRWDRYSAHALAVRDVAAALARSTTNSLHVLSVYDYFLDGTSYDETDGMPPKMADHYQDEIVQSTDDLMTDKMDQYVAPLIAAGFPITTLLRAGDSREIIVQVAQELQADLLIIGAHSKRSIFDLSLGGTARQISKHAPCTVLLVSPHQQNRPRASISDDDQRSVASHLGARRGIHEQREVAKAPVSN